MTVADLPPLWRDHYEESVAIGLESIKTDTGPAADFIRRDRLAEVVRCIEAERVASLLGETLGAKRVG
jgi:hypothetical protein